MVVIIVAACVIIPKHDFAYKSRQEFNFSGDIKVFQNCFGIKKRHYFSAKKSFFENLLFKNFQITLELLR